MATIDDVNAEAQDNKLKALQAMAAGQSDPYNSGQQQIRDSQSQALGTLATTAAQGNAPAPAIDEVTPAVTGPGDAALAAMAGSAGAHANDLSAINATGVAYGGSTPSLSGVSGVSGGKQFPVQMYGPYARYGGYGSQGEFDDAVTAAARQAAGAAHQGVVDERVLLANQLQSHNRSHQLGKDLGPSTGPPIQTQGPDGTVTTLPPEHMYQPFASPEQTALAQQASQAFHGVPALPHHTIPVPVPTAPGPVAAGLTPSALTELQLFGARGAPIDPAQDPANPMNLYRFAQQAAIDHGAAPMYSKGHFSPEWGATLALQDLVQPNSIVKAQNEYSDRQANGGFTPSELNQRSAAQQALAAAAVKGSPEYQQGALAVQGILQQEAAGSQSPMSVDGLRLILIKQGLPPDVIVQLTKDFGGAFVGGAAANVLDPNGLSQLLGAQQTGP